MDKDDNPEPLNVGKACLQKVDPADDDTAYNECFNNIQLKATNELRYQHLADSVQIDTVLAPKLHKTLSEVTDMKIVKDCWTMCLRRKLDAEGEYVLEGGNT
jgi:hypothetical protein